MKITTTKIPDLLIIEPRVFEDKRGYFFESYNQAAFEKQNLPAAFIQDNESKSVFGTIRGLHYQLAPYAQTKLMRVVEGAIWDVAVDIRQGSPTYGKWEGIELTAENKKQLLIPKGFAHGFAVLSEQAIVQYKCDAFYAPKAEQGIYYADTALDIDWRIPADKAILSPKDTLHPMIKEAEMNFTY
jgi:dTDP-4-dehydrorhamnose 3,5-epimerase